MKNTLKNEVMKKLLDNWYSNFGINMACHSSSADRTMREIRKNPPVGFKIVQRPKEMPETYRPCLEYRLVRNDSL